MTEKPTPLAHLAFYRFTPIIDPNALSDTLRAGAESRELLGTVIVAPEGINGMLAGPREGVQAFSVMLSDMFPGAVQHLTDCAALPFRSLKIKRKDEIVTMRTGDVPVTARPGTHIAPETLRDWLRNPDEELVLVDVRNDFEVKLGSFRGALNPDTVAFHEFPEVVRQHAEAWKAAPRVVMFCTGGIRCEKATSWMLGEGFDEVFQLDGGIINYFRTIEDADRDWDGELFIFDDRIALDTKLNTVSGTRCTRCGAPVDPACHCAPVASEA